MGQEKMLAIIGNSGSGKTIVSIKLACALATKKKNVIVVFCDPFIPVIPALLPPSVIHDISLGALLTEPGLTQTNILNACVPSPSNEYISLLGYRMGENLLNYPKITRDKAVELFVSLRYLADYVIFDCSTIFEADLASLVAVETADKVLKIWTANLKGMSYYQSHIPMLEDSRYRKDSHLTAIGNLKVGQDWEAVSGQYGGVNYVLPYTAELEQQDNEQTLFESMFSSESVPYQTEINRILFDVFSFPVIQSKKLDKKTESGHVSKEKKEKGKRNFKLPFARNKGEF